MKIDGYGRILMTAADQAGEGRSGRDGARETAARSRDADRDCARFSEAARRLEAGEDEAPPAEDRLKKVRELRERIRSGTYKPDIAEIALHLVGDGLRLLG